MTTDLVPTFLDSIDELPADIPGAQFEPGRLNWYHGINAGGVKAPGVFYAKETAFTELPPPAPWVRDERFDGEIGYSAPELRIAFVGERSQWFVPGDKQGDPAKEWLLSYREPRSPDEKIKKLIEYLVLIDGLDAPMVLSLSGYYKTKPITKIIQTYKRGALVQLMRQKKRALPDWSFWLTIANQRTKDGKTDYLKAETADGEEKGSIVTPPALVVPPQLVTKEVMMAGIEAYQQFTALGWFKFKRTPQGVTEAVYAIEEHPALPPGRNTPQALSNDDLPDPFA